MMWFTCPCVNPCIMYRFTYNIYTCGYTELHKFRVQHAAHIYCTMCTSSEFMLWKSIIRVYAAVCNIYSSRYPKYMLLQWKSIIRVYAAAIPASLPRSSSDRLSDAAAAPRQLFKPADARLTGRSFKHQLLHHRALNAGFNSDSSQDLALEGFAINAMEEIRRGCSRQKLAAAVGGRSSCDCCSCSCLQSLWDKLDT